MKKLTLLLIFLFAFRVWFFYHWSGKHDDAFFTHWNNIREAVTWVGLGAMSGFVFHFCKDMYCALALWVFRGFSYSFAFISLRDYMPISVHNFIVEIRPAFFDTWSIIAIVTVGYYLLTFRLKTA